jgi:hypothetical protein
LKTLLDCSPFWSNRVYLKWRSKRLSFFVRTKRKRQQKPSSGSSEVSLEQLFRKSAQQDMYYRSSLMEHQSFCVFQLVPSMRSIAVTEFGLLPTPSTKEVDRKNQPGCGQTVRDNDKEGRETTNIYQGRAAETRDGKRADPHCDRDGQDGSECQYEIHTGKKWKYAQCNPFPAHSHAPNTVGKGLERAASEGIKGKMDDLPGTIKFLAGMNGQLNPCLWQK